MLAVRANERAAAAVGVDVVRTKLVAFALAGFVAGIGGALIGYHQGAVSTQSFAVYRSLLLLAATYIGGVASYRGALVGGLVVPGGLVASTADRVLHLGEYTTLASALVVTVLAVRSARSVKP
jgi:branched-chain amino acid transport system permease protein